MKVLLNKKNFLYPLDSKLKTEIYCIHKIVSIKNNIRETKKKNKLYTLLYIVNKKIYSYGGEAN